MMLATTTVENVDRFLEVFAGKGADKRAHHGCKGSTVFRDPTQQNQVWGNFVADPEVPPILKEAGHVGKPLPAALIGEYRA
jgi:hypothetical protein